MSSGGNQLNKIRTFHSDMERVNPGSIKKSDITLASKPLAADLPPVLTPKAPIAPTRPSLPLKKPIKPNIPTSKIAAKTPVVANTQAPIPNKPTAVIPKLAPSNTLSKNIDKEVASLSSKHSTNNDDLNLMDTDSSIADGTIITDQKRKRFRLFPAMWEATVGWIEQGKEAIEEREEKRQAAIPKVNTIKGREEVVQKAAKQSALAPKDDYKKWAAKQPKNLKQRPHHQEAALTIKKKDPTKKASWSHFAGEEKQSAIPAPAGKPTDKNREASLTTSPSVIPLLHNNKPVSTINTNSAIKIEPVEIAITSTEPNTSAAKKPKPVVRPPTLTTPPSSNKQRRGWQISPYVWYGLIVIVALSTTGGGVALSLWMFNNDTNEIDKPFTQLPVSKNEGDTLSQNSGLTLIPLPSSREVLYEEIKNNTAASGLSAITITTTEEGSSVTASTEKILAVLDWEASAPLLRAINKIEFGTYESSPYVILRVTSFDTAFGGILAAEANLSKDLAPLFGEPVISTFDPNAETEDKMREPYFVDDLVDNIDVRVLHDETEAERIVYGFLNKNTIVIVTNAEVFAGMAARIK